MKELALYLTAKSQGDPRSPTKLNKLLFYCDFMAYQHFSRSMTGYSYQKLPLGPEPKAVQQAFGSSTLSAEELRLADQVIEELWERSDSELSDHLDNFMGRKMSDYNEVILYETVLWAML